MKKVDVLTIIKKINELEKAKESKVEEIIRQSKPISFIGEEIRNETVLHLVTELREIEEQLNEFQFLTVEVEDDFKI
ncbi:hypothetical protein ACU3L3_06975 [Priestia endophytica]